jgi:hypothetical protein
MYLPTEPEAIDSIVGKEASDVLDKLSLIVSDQDEDFNKLIENNNEDD